MIRLEIYAQDPVVDSLNFVLKTSKEDTTKIKILTELSEICEIEDILKYSEPSAKLCLKLIASSSKNSNSYFFYARHLATAYNNIGFLASEHGDLSKTLFYYHKSLKISEDIKDEEGIANSLNNLGFIYNKQGNIVKALDYHYRGFKINEKRNNKSGMALYYINTSFIFLKQGDNQKAMEYLQNCLKIREEIKDRDGIAYCLNNMGAIFKNTGDKNKAMDYFVRSLKIREELNDKSGIANCIQNIGSVYSDLGDKVKALEKYRLALKIQEGIKDKDGMTTSLNSIASILFHNGSLSESKIYALRSLQIAKEIGYPEDISRAAMGLKNIYQKQNNYKEALEMFELEIQMRDSINTQENRKASIKKQFQYEYEKQAAADSVKHAEEQKVKNAQLQAQAASLKQEKTQRYALYGGLLLVIGFSVFVFNRFKVTQKQKKIIEQQKILVDQAYESLHEKNKEVLDSITYARRIQRALITSEMYIDKTLNRLNNKS